MDRDTYKTIETYMLNMMDDSAHDSQHIYRVLYQALKISSAYNEVNTDVLIASCLLHDIGRKFQFQNPNVCHAAEGGKIAYSFLKELGWNENWCLHVKNCIATHRFRTNNQPKSIKAKILFDAEKLDVTGALGIARSLIYKGMVREPIYTVNENHLIQDGKKQDDPESFLKEYHFKLIKIYDQFYTKEAFDIAQKRKNVLCDFMDELMYEISNYDLEQLLNL